MINITYNHRTNNIEIRAPYDERAVQILKLNFRNRKFNKPNRSAWEIPVESGEGLKERLEHFIEQSGGDPNVTVSDSVWNGIEVIENIKTIQYELSQAPDDTGSQLVNNVFGGSLEPVQRATVRYMTTLPAGVICGDDESYNPRTSVLASLEIMQEYPALVICPDNKKFLWGSEFKRRTRRGVYVMDTETILVHDARENAGVEQLCELGVVNYGILEKYLGWIITIPWRSIVIDEGHHMRSSGSVQYNICRDLARDTLRHKYILSHTDYMNKPWELVNQLDILDRLPLFNGRDKFINAYTYLKNGTLTAKNTQDLDRILRENCYVGHAEPAAIQKKLEI